MLLSAAVNNLGNMLYFSPDVDLVAFFVYVDCHRAVGLDFLQGFDVHILYLLFLKRVDECDAVWDIIFSALLLQLVYDVDVVCR